jgi:hypothetical protein
LVEKIEDLEFKNMLSNEGDELSAVLQITAEQEEQKAATGLLC